MIIESLKGGQELHDNKILNRHCIETVHIITH